MKKLITSFLIVSSSIIMLLIYSNITMAKDFDAKDKALTLGISGSSTLGGVYYLNDNFSINPSISYSRQDTAGAITESYSLGTGFFYHFKLSENVDFFTGPIIAYNYSSQDYTDHTSTQETESTSLTGALGIQYMFNHNLGISGLIGLKYSQGKICYETGGYTDSTESTETFGTIQSQISIVYYF